MNYPHPCQITYPKFHETTSTWVSREERNYLSNVNYNLVNEINEAEAEKHFYRTKLSHQVHNHHDELEEAFRIISERNSQIIAMEEELDRHKKDLRAAADDYISLKRDSEAQQEYCKAEMERTKIACEEKMKKFEEESEKKYELKLKKRVQQVENECNDRVSLLNGQIAVLTENSKNLMHELSLLQEDYRQMLLKNDTIIQESIHRELRKRDFEAQNNYLRDLAQYETIKKDRNQLKEQIQEGISKIGFLEGDNRKLVAKLQVEKQRVKDLEEAVEELKKVQKIQLVDKYKDVCDTQTNTDKQFVPIAMPIDTNLMSQVVSLKEFLIEKIVNRFLDFFQKAAGTDNKKTSKSLITFKNCLEEMKTRNPELKILFFMHTNLEKIIKIYCPSMNNYSREYLTIKDEFIKRTLMECETISSHPQRLFRLLDLFFRIKNPINHLYPDITAGELKLVEIKLLTCLKKNFA